MQNNKSKIGIQALVLGVFLAMILACASSQTVVQDGAPGGTDNPTSAEVIYEPVDSIVNIQLPNESDMASI